MHHRGEVAVDHVAAPAAPTARLGLGSLLRGKGRSAGLIAALVVVFAVTGAHSTLFLSRDNLRVLGLQMAFVAIAGVGTTLLLITANIDLSIGSTFAMAAILSAMFSKAMPVPAAFALTIVVAGFIGMLNGVLVWNVPISPLIITLGSMLFLRGIVLVLTKGYAVTGVPDSYTTLANLKPLGIPMPIVAFIVLALITFVFLSTTKIGRHLYAVGGNREASQKAGLNVRAIVIGVFAVSGMLVGVAGLLSGSLFGAPDATYGVNFELNVITAVILGGVSFAGGEGGVIGAMLGAALLSVIDGSIVSLGINPFWAQAVKGAILIIAVSADQVAHVQRERMQKAMAMREQARLEEEREQHRALLAKETAT